MRRFLCRWTGVWPRTARGDLRTGDRGNDGVGAGGGDGDGGCGGRRALQGTGWREEEEDLRAFELLLGIVIGANLGWNKVGLGSLSFWQPFFFVTFFFLN